MAASMLACALIFIGDLTFQPNFAQNPSFEEDQNRDEMVDGWRAMSFESPARLQWDATAARTGTRSLSISDSFREQAVQDWKQYTGRWVSNARPIKPGTEYRLEVWAKTKGVTGRASAHLAWQQGTKWLSEITTERVSGDHDWTQLSVQGIAPANADRVVVSLNLANSRGTVWFDDVQVSGVTDEMPTVTYVFHDTDDWFPFEFPLDDTNLDTIDLTRFLDAPAGKHGFLTARPDGHFYFEDGTRARFFGTNVVSRYCAPPKQQAPVVAARLAKYGVNLLRLHSMDGRGGPLIDYRDGTSRTFNPDALDRIDYFIAELKERGIYVYIDLLDYRWFRTADGVKEGDQFTSNWQGSMKGASIFDPRMIELQKDYATRLLTHRNPYTGLRYVDDPAIAVVEITNENSIFYFFNMSDLSRPLYREELQRRWNVWLADEYESRGQLQSAWTDEDGWCGLQPGEDPREQSVLLPFGMLGRYRPQTEKPSREPLLSPLRVRDVYRFFAEVQRRYYSTMREHLGQLGVRVPIAGTNQQFVVVDTQVDAQNDFMSRNQYWRHPHRQALPFFKFANEPMLSVDIPTQRTPFAVIARTSVAGKPQAVAEFNFPWPNEYRCEGLLMAAAYSCLQDWDMFLLFSYDPIDKQLTMFRSQSDPARWGQFPAAALMFHRQDVKPALNEIHVIHTPEDTLSLRPHTRNAQYTNYRYLAYTSKVRNSFIQDAYRGDADAVLACGLSVKAVVRGTARPIRLAARPWETWLYPDFVKRGREAGLPGYAQLQADLPCLKSDTGELSLDYGSGLWTVDTDHSQSAVGYLARAGKIQLGGMTIECRTPFASITASSLDGAKIGQSRRLLLTCVARAENTGQGFWPPDVEQQRWTTVAWMLPAEGRSPVIAEPVEARISLPVPGTASVYALDVSGKRAAKIAANQVGGWLTFNPSAARSIWCEVVVSDAE